MYRTTQVTQKRKDEKKQMILDTAAKVFSSKGYHDTTVKDVVDTAGISVGTFYFYFKGKEELFLTLYQNIIKEFEEVTMGVVDVEHFTLIKNYTRVMIATLWMYEQKQEIAKILLLEAAAATPNFQQMEMDRVHKFVEIMETWFRVFNRKDGVNIPDEHAAALIYTSSYNYVINEWLVSDRSIPLTDYGYAFCIYHLQALRITFDDSLVTQYINEVLDELKHAGL